MQGRWVATLAWTGDGAEVNLQDNKLTITAFVFIVHIAQKYSMEGEENDSAHGKLGGTASLLQTSGQEGEEGTADGCGSRGGPGFGQSQQSPQHLTGH